MLFRSVLARRLGKKPLPAGPRLMRCGRFADYAKGRQATFLRPGAMVLKNTRQAALPPDEPPGPGPFTAAAEEEEPPVPYADSLSPDTEEPEKQEEPKP